MRLLNSRQPTLIKPLFQTENEQRQKQYGMLEFIVKRGISIRSKENYKKNNVKKDCYREKN